MNIFKRVSILSKLLAVPEPPLTNEETALEVAISTPPRSEEHRGEDAVMVTMQDVNDSGMEVVQTNIYQRSRQLTASNPETVMVANQDCSAASIAVGENNIDRRPEQTAASNPVPMRSIQKQLGEVQLENQAIPDKNQSQKKHTFKTRREMNRLSPAFQRSPGIYNGLYGAHTGRQGVKLQRTYFELQRTHDELRDAYSRLQRGHDELRGTHGELRDDYSRLQRTHDELRGDYFKLLRTHDELRDDYADVQHCREEQVCKFEKMAKEYEDLDKKYMGLARALQVTEDDRSTINKKLCAVASSIENLVIRGRGNGSVNLNRGAAIQHFRNTGLLENLTLQENQLEPLHYSLLMEATMMMILNFHLFSKPLECIFDGSRKFEAICNWMERRGSTVTARWRQELCLLIAQDDGEMKLKKKKAVDLVIMDLERLVSSVYGNVDTNMSDKIKELCDVAFDLSYAMFGMESKVYPTRVKVGTPFNEEEMTLAKRSDPSGSVSFMVFPRFQDSNNKLYFKAKVWCPSKEPEPEPKPEPGPELDQNKE